MKKLTLKESRKDGGVASRGTCKDIASSSHIPTSSAMDPPHSSLTQERNFKESLVWDGQGVNPQGTPDSGPRPEQAT
ncbi:hypothetical protein LINPERHAP2_LOCUS3517 [Linum perenne]